MPLSAHKHLDNAIIANLILNMEQMRTLEKGRDRKSEQQTQYAVQPLHYKVKEPVEKCNTKHEIPEAVAAEKS